MRAWDVEVELYDGGEPRRVRLDSMPRNILSLLGDAVGETETPLLVVESWGRYRVVTGSHLIDLAKKPPARYELAKMEHLGMVDEQHLELSFTYEGANVVLSGTEGVLYWLSKHGTSPTYGYDYSVEWWDAYRRRVRWIQLPLPWRKATEEALDTGELPVVVISHEKHLDWVCTNSAWIDFRKRGPRRYDLHAIRDLTWQSGFLQDRVTFSYEADTVKLPDRHLSEAVLRHWPHLAPELVVQPDELMAASPDDFKPSKLACMVDVNAGKMTYAPWTVNVLTRRQRGNTISYFQTVDCPYCGNRLAIRIRKDKPLELLYQSEAPAVRTVWYFEFERHYRHRWA